MIWASSLSGCQKCWSTVRSGVLDALRVQPSICCLPHARPTRMCNKHQLLSFVYSQREWLTQARASTLITYTCQNKHTHIGESTSSVMKLKLSRIIPMNRLSMMFSQTTLVSIQTLKVIPFESPQSETVDVKGPPFQAFQPGINFSSNDGVHSGHSTEQSVIITCHSSPVTTW